MANRKLLLALVAVSTLFVSAPAQAQYYHHRHYHHWHHHCWYRHGRRFCR